jgi:hypothetical protein
VTEGIHEAARDWLLDCFPDDEDTIKALTDAQTEAAVERHYEGGWDEFEFEHDFEYAEANYPGGWMAFIQSTAGDHHRWRYELDYAD